VRVCARACVRVRACVCVRACARFIRFNSIYFCSYDPEAGYGPQDTEHVNSI
jgi:hypothetical protein